MSLDALDQLVRDYPGSYGAMALRLKIDPGHLRAQLKPSPGSTAKLGWTHALAIIANAQQVGMPGALSPLDAAELEFGRMAVPLPQLGEGADEGLLHDLGALAKEFGDVVAEVSAAPADGNVTDNELARANTQARELMSALQQVLRDLQRMNAAAKPKDLVAHVRRAA